MIDKRIAVWCAASIVVAFGAGMAVQRHIVLRSSMTDVALVRLQGRYQFISPLLSCEIPELLGTQRMEPLRELLQRVVSEANTIGSARRVGVYFRDFSTGQSLGIHEQEHFWPASMMKVPTLMSVLWYAQSHPDFFDKKIQYAKLTDENQVQHYQSAKRAQLGKTYTTRELLELMIRYSDNNATAAVRTAVDSSAFRDVFTDIGVSLPTEDSVLTDFMTPKIYAYFFRILYNASYLRKSNSEYALELLSNTDFKSGLVSGVPNGITVSHKFGEWQWPDGRRQLHDCGVVYHHASPYLLCVMTEGTSYDSLARVIAEISRVTYDFVSHQAPR